MNGALSQTVCRIRLFLLAVMCWLCVVPAAHAIRPPSPAELQLKGEAPCQEPLAYWPESMLDGELRNGLFVLNNPLRYTDPSGHGPIDDALFNTETIKSSWQLATMHDTGWNKAWEIPVATIGIVAGVADAGFNVMSLGGKGALEGGGKELIKVGVEKLGKEAPHIVQQSAKIGAEREAKTAAELAAKKTSDEVVQGQRLLRDAEGKKVIDQATGTGRRVDHAVINREANTAKTYETTGMDVSKKAQIEKEGRIREAGGTYIRDKETRQLVPVQKTSEVIRQP